MKLNKYFILFTALSFQAYFSGCTGQSSTANTETVCSTLLCRASKYSLLVADIDGSNVSLIKTSSYQDMTHPRVSSDKNWVAYTTYNDLNSDSCATHDQGYLNTEIKAIRISGTDDKTIIHNVSGELNSNSYWIGSTNEFTYLSGPPSALKFYRTTVNASMDVTSGPNQISVPGTILPMDPVPHLATNKIVYPGLYDSGGGAYVKSIFIMNLSNSANVVGLSLGRDRLGNAIVCSNASCSNIMENDPKISPDGTKVAFMRQAPDSGANGFGWHIFVVPVASPLNEVDISDATLGSDVYKNDVLPEWIDNNKIIFSTIEIASSSDYSKSVYTMNADGSNRTKLNLPAGFRYADVFPFVDSLGRTKIILSAEKIGVACSR